jgi:hypothetical protein
MHVIITDSDKSYDTGVHSQVTNMSFTRNDAGEFFATERFPNLKNLNCSGTGLTTLQINSKSLEKMHCNLNYQMKTITLDCSSLQYLQCIANDLSSIHLNCPSLKTLDCRSNKIQNLDNLPASLRDLHCDHNQLTRLTINSDSLKNVSCTNNDLFELSVTGLGLEELRCSFNKIRSLKMISSSLRTLYCSANEMQMLSLCCPILVDLNCSLNMLEKTDLDCPQLKAFGHGSDFFNGNNELEKAKEMHKCFSDSRITFDLALRKSLHAHTSCRYDSDSSPNQKITVNSD